MAKSNDPETWARFDVAHATARKQGIGIGFVFTAEDTVVGVDLDDCRDPESGQPDEWARGIIERLDSWTEVSPSGTGYHVYVHGEVPEGGNRCGGVEMYDSGRFFTVTGEYVPGTPDTINERKGALQDVHIEFIADDENEPKPAKPSDSIDPGAGFDGDDRQLIERAKSANNGDKFRRLWRGDTSGYGSHSEADIALCRILAFWVGANAERINRLFRQSGLMRPKWDRRHYADGRTYGEGTIQEAIDSQNTFYQGSNGEETETDSDVKSVGDSLTVDAARDRCRSLIRDAVENGEQVIIDALPTLGKSYSAAEIANEVDYPVTYLTHRIENRKQVAEWAREIGLLVYMAPRFFEDCPTAAGEFGEEEKERVRTFWDKGTTPRAIHRGDSELPCQTDGRCPYTSRSDFEADSYDLLIGSPGHSYVPSYVENRAVIIDEDPGEAYQIRLGESQLQDEIGNYLSNNRIRGLEGVGTIFGILSRRNHTTSRERALTNLSENDDLRDYSGVFKSQYRADAPALVYALLGGQDLGNGIERTELPSGEIGVYDRKEGELILRDPSDLSEAHAVVGLDGTPHIRQWRGKLGVPDLEHRQVLTDAERQQYLTDVLGNRYVQTTENVVPCYGGEYVNPDEGARLARWVDNRHDEKPALISSTEGLGQLVDNEDAPAAEFIDGSKHYNALKGSNEFEGRTVGIVYGAPQLSDREIQLRAALDGQSIEPDRSEGAVTFGDIGDEYLGDSRGGEVAQAALRFGRNGGGATVYVHTSAVPDWLPTETQEVPSEGELQVRKALSDLGRASTGEIAEVSGLSTRQVRSHLRKLRETKHVKTVGGGRSTKHIWCD